ncbi:Cytochrome c oxidase subunit 6 [Tieghemiomyces parasiticus]|uniref:Cytochrome c oxidase subunit 6, mitochondrial n=1 Tax=Tieghemiomyces parasiticus TaxID=78921 RepID=A0A9W8DXT8_9FUNG|nr:Cytochrome c oxidase subunit 6 [Tieghemiomyces parasiticus]
MLHLIPAFRVAAVSRAAQAARIARPAPLASSTFVRAYSSAHDEESFEAFTERYIKFFDGVDEVFELQRGLNNCFSYDLVPAPEVIEAVFKAARRVNDFTVPTRVFEALKEKVENESQYQQYLEVLKPLKEELGINTKEELGF